MDIDFLLLRKKKAIIMDLFIVFVTIVFIGVCLLHYFNSQESIHASVVAPNKVLELSDEELLFSIEEKSLLVNSYCDNNDAEEMKDEFCNDFNKISEKTFLTENSIPKESSTINNNNFCQTIYDFDLNSDELTVQRSGLMKIIDLKNEEDNKKLNFNFELEYDLDKEYLLTKDLC